MEHAHQVLLGATAMASLAVATFFLKFWRRTRDSLFLFFAAGFAIDAVSRLWRGLSQVTDESEPIYYLPRLVMFGLIMIAIIRKNAPRQDR